MKFYNRGAWLTAENNLEFEENRNLSPKEGRDHTIAYQILDAHNSGEGDQYKIRFDSITSHDITYVGIIQTAIASGMKEFPIPYVMTNCHNSLCAVGGTINEDDHKFALSAAKKFGGIYVPPNLAVIHSFNREMMSGCGRMILGSDSHTRYGALGTLAMGEGGGELAKQLLEQTYDIKAPEVILVYLTGEPKPWIGPHDVALQMVKAVFDEGLVKNKILEFAGPGLATLPIEFRNGIDVMTTETTCLSSIWVTDEETKSYFENHGRPEAYKRLEPKYPAYYDGVLEINLSEIKPSIALPFHPSNVYTIEEFKADPLPIMKKVEEQAKKVFEDNDVDVDFQSKYYDGQIHVDQGIIVGCSGGTFDNIDAARDILAGADTGNDVFSMSVYPGSQPIYLDLVRSGAVYDLMQAGVTVKSAFCGPCFGAGDTPANGEFSIRHATRNFPNRDGSKPNEGQYSLIALMDAKSIAATARMGGVLTGADEIEVEYQKRPYHFDPTIYKKRVWNSYQDPHPEETLQMGPNIKPWPEMPELEDELLIRIVSHITDPVTTTDELIPSGETSSYRSNPLRLAEFTLSRKDPDYVKNAKKVLSLQGDQPNPELKEELEAVRSLLKEKGLLEGEGLISSAIYANKPGDGSAREQAASSQRVLGAGANFAMNYATKRYRSNLINWGMLPFLVEGPQVLQKGDWVFVKGMKSYLEGKGDFKAYVIREGNLSPLETSLGELNEREKSILSAGSLINRNRADKMK